MEKILPIKPKEYIESGVTNCGGCSAKAILGAFGKDDRDKPNEYYTFKMGIMSSPSHWERLFIDNGLMVRKTSFANDENVVQIIKKELNSNRIVMLRVGNGYTKKGRWFWFPWIFVGHWITVWGYNDDRQKFYVYDSWMPNKDNLSIGNVERTFSEISRDVKGGFPFSWRRNYLTVSV